MADVITSSTTQLRPSGRLAALEREIERTRRTLSELWRKASPADRVFAVDRLMRETLLSPHIAQRLAQVQDAVRDAWATARVATRPAVFLGGGSTISLSTSPVDASLASLQLALVERDRDTFLADHGLFDPLFVAAESYLREVPMISGAPTLKTLLHEREIIRASLVRILPPVDDDVAVAHGAVAADRAPPMDVDDVDGISVDMDLDVDLDVAVGASSGSH